MPKPIKKEILRALEAYQQRVAGILTKQGVKAHIVGDLNAYKKLTPIAIDFGSAQRGAKEFGVKYGKLLRKEGATMIHGKKVAWLAESMKDTRGKVADIINEGVRTGKGTDAIARELRGSLIRDKNYEYKRIARTETGNIQAEAADKRYKEEEVEEVDWLCGQNPCDKCAQYCGKRYKIDEAPLLLVHPNCTCDKAPVVTRKVRAKIDRKSVETKKKPELILKKLAPAKKKLAKPKKKLVTKKEKIEELKKGERATANELWKKTDKDGFEHLKATNSKTTYADGNKHHVAYTLPKTPFKAQHTHPNWDCPLSEGDLTNFLTAKNMTQTSASSSKNIYLAVKRPETIIPKERSDLLKAKIGKMSDEINKRALKEFKKKTGWSPTKTEAKKIWRGAIDETNKAIAKEYKFDYISFRRK